LDGGEGGSEASSRVDASQDRHLGDVVGSGGPDEGLGHQEGVSLGGMRKQGLDIGGLAVATSPPAAQPQDGGGRARLGRHWGVVGTHRSDSSNGSGGYADSNKLTDDGWANAGDPDAVRTRLVQGDPDRSFRYRMGGIPNGLELVGQCRNGPPVAGQVDAE